MNPLVQRIITIVAGALAAVLAQHIPAVNEQHAADILSAILMAFAVGWASRHPADKAVQLSGVNIIAYDKLMSANRDPSKPDGEKR